MSSLAPITMPYSGPYPGNDPLRPVWFKVKSVVEEIPNVVTVIIAPQDPETQCHFKPGQFNMLYLFGQGEVPISYSGPPQDQQQFHHTIRNVGMVTHALSELKPGGLIGVRGPFGTSWPLDKAQGKDIVIVAGGLGLAPLRPVLYAILNNRDAYGRVCLLFGTRLQSDILFLKELWNWQSADNGIDVEMVVSAATSSWTGKIGTVLTLLQGRKFDPERTIAFTCGPEIMMRLVSQALAAQGLPTSQIFLSMERNMKCAVGFCGHCQFGPQFICKDGPIFSYDQIAHWINIREI